MTYSKAYIIKEQKYQLYIASANLCIHDFSIRKSPVGHSTLSINFIAAIPVQYPAKMSCSGERRVMKLNDKEIEKERTRERELESETADDNPPKEIIEHFSHPHPLTYTSADYARFCCSICMRTGHGKRYHCTECKFDLHRTCAKSPLTWLWHIPADNIEPFSSHQREVINTTFAHPVHPVTMEFNKQSFRCDHCNTPGKGSRFVCHTCDVEFHQVCAKNPTRLNT